MVSVNYSEETLGHSLSRKTFSGDSASSVAGLSSLTFVLISIAIVKVSFLLVRTVISIHRIVAPSASVGVSSSSSQSAATETVVFEQVIFIKIKVEIFRNGVVLTSQSNFISGCP